MGTAGLGRGRVIHPSTTYGSPRRECPSLRDPDLRIEQIRVPTVDRSAAFPLLESESKRVGLYRGVADDYCTLPASLGPGRDDPAGSDRLPVALQLCLAWGFERVMKIPLVAIAQVRILAEGAFQPLRGCGTLPERLAPKTHMHREQIRKGLPPARRLGLRDLRFCT